MAETSQSEFETKLNDLIEAARSAGYMAKTNLHDDMDDVVVWCLYLVKMEEPRDPLKPFWGPQHEEKKSLVEMYPHLDP